MKIVWNNDVDWELKMAFVRLDFPPSQRHTAQSVAAAFGHVIGLAVLRLRPEHTLGEIEFLGGGMDDDFAIGFERYTFREFVEYLSRDAHTR